MSVSQSSESTIMEFSMDSTQVESPAKIRSKSDIGDDDSKDTTTGRWTQAEHELFIEGLKRFSKQWKSIADLIQTRTVVQIRTHAQKYFQKLNKSKLATGLDSNELELDAAIMNTLKGDQSPKSPKVKRKQSEMKPRSSSCTAFESENSPKTLKRKRCMSSDVFEAKSSAPHEVFAASNPNFAASEAKSRPLHHFGNLKEGRVTSSPENIDGSLSNATQDEFMGAADKQPTPADYAAIIDLDDMMPMGLGCVDWTHEPVPCNSVPSNPFLTRKQPELSACSLSEEPMCTEILSGNIFTRQGDRVTSHAFSSVTSSLPSIIIPKDDSELQVTKAKSVTPVGGLVSVVELDLNWLEAVERQDGVPSAVDIDHIKFVSTDFDDDEIKSSLGSDYTSYEESMTGSSSDEDMNFFGCELGSDDNGCFDFDMVYKPFLTDFDITASGLGSSHYSVEYGAQKSGKAVPLVSPASVADGPVNFSGSSLRPFPTLALKPTPLSTDEVKRKRGRPRQKQAAENFDVPGTRHP